MTFGSLFAGIGGFDLGLERAGMVCKWQVEIDPFCRAVLAKHWPEVKRYEDVRTVGAELGSVDLVCGGFPCQDISVAGRGVGIDGERSGLWSQFDRLIGELRPRYVVVENVSALLARGLGRVLGDLAARGYDAEWDCIPASAVGAPHIRDRVWIVAYTNDRRELQPRGGEQIERRWSGNGGQAVADANGSRPQERLVFRGFSREEKRYGDRQNAALGAWWIAEPNVGRVAHGVSGRVDRLRSLGNAIVPQIAEWLGRRILEADAANQGDF